MVEESQVVTRYAYVLFYRRRNSPVERPPRFLRPLGAESSGAAGDAASQVRVLCWVETGWRLGGDTQQLQGSWAASTLQDLSPN